MQDWGKSTISTQDEWKGVRLKYPKRGDHKKFSKENEFNPRSVLTLTGMPIREALPGSRSENPTGRYKIFEAIESGDTVETANRKAKQVSKDATKDGDVFIGLHARYWRIGSAAPTLAR